MFADAHMLCFRPYTVCRIEFVLVLVLVLVLVDRSMAQGDERAPPSPPCPIVAMDGSVFDQTDIALRRLEAICGPAGIFVLHTTELIRRDAQGAVQAFRALQHARARHGRRLQPPRGGVQPRQQAPTAWPGPPGFRPTRRRGGQHVAEVAAFDDAARRAMRGVLQCLIMHCATGSPGGIRNAMACRDWMLRRLEEAFGGGKLELQLHSQLLLAYKKVCDGRA